MNKRDRVKRFLALLLTFAMIFQQAGITTIADETEAAVTQQSETTETKVQASAPETNAPETKAPETQAPETQAPETQAPETKAPETSAPATEAAETSAPETQAPETSATETGVPETNAPETQAPETEAPATAAPETQLTEAPQTETAVAESETEVKETETEAAETETETEAPKTHFTYEDSRVKITADAEKEANLPQDAVLKADYLAPGSEAYNAAVAAFTAQLGSTDTDVVVDYVLYDIYFTSEIAGGRIEPEDGKVKVEISFKTPEKTQIEGDVVDSEVVHLDNNNEAEIVESGKVDVSSDGAIHSMSFTNDSFSPFGVRLSFAKNAAPETESNEYYMSLEDAKSITLKLVMEDSVKNAIQNKKIEISCTYYDATQTEITGIQPDKIRDLQIGGMAGGLNLANYFQNVDKRVGYVKITLQEHELEKTFYTFAEGAPVREGNDLRFTITKRTFQPDEVWHSGDLTYVAIGPKHQYKISGPLGIISNFHAVGFSRVMNSVHTNGNILTESFDYGSNFGTKNLSNEISYIRTFTKNTVMTCGLDNSILVVGKDVEVTCTDEGFYLNGNKLNTPKTIYQDTEEYSFLDLNQAKADAISRSQNWAACQDQGTTLTTGKVIVDKNYNGMAVLNITLEDLQNHTQIEGLTNGSGKTLLINLKVSGESAAIPGLSLNGMGNASGEQVDFSAGKLIWNILDANGNPYTGEITQAEATTGTIFIPKGTFTTLANWNGSMIANIVNIKAESHRTDFTGTMGFGVTKSVKKGDSDGWDKGYKFEFELSADEGTPMPLGSTEESGKVVKEIEASFGNRTPSFGEIAYSNDDIGKTYVYTIRELVSDIPHISSSTDVYTIEAKIESNEGVGLKITRKYRKNDGEWMDMPSDDTQFEFVNTYEDDTKGAITISKKVDGEAKEFEGIFYFTVQGESDNKYYDLDGNSYSEVKVLALQYAKNAGNITLNNLSAGTYIITEVADANGTTIDTETFPYTVSKISGKVMLKDGQKVAYDVTNKKKYEATGSLNLTAEKALSGKTLKEGTYSFQLKDKEGAVLQTKTNGADGSITFDAIDYSLEDAGKEFTYTVEEVAGNEAGVTYDGSQYTVKARVSDDGSGNLTVTTKVTKDGKEVNAIVFSNKYEAAGSLELTAEKKLSGKDLEAGKYSFVLKKLEGEKEDVLQTKTNGADGSITFDPIPYGIEDAGKTYRYSVSEELGSENGVTYDRTEYVVTVTVSDNGDGTLSVEKTVATEVAPADGEKGELVPVEEMVFHNEYKATGSLNLTAEKALSGKTLKEGTYSFQLKDKEGAVLQTKTNGADGSITFDAIDYSLEDAGKEFTYTVEEVIGTEAGVTYDRTKYVVTVRVSDNGNGTLKIEKTIEAKVQTEKEKEPEFKAVDKITFHNEYKATGTLSLAAQKNLSGKMLEAEKYSFQLKDKEGAVLQTKVNAADGSVIFDPINYSLKDAGKDFTYTVEEVEGTEAGVTYDSSKYTVVASVVDNGDGKLVVTTVVKKEKEEVNAIIFNNEYKAAETTAQISAEKTVNGEAASGSQFQFTLTPKTEGDKNKAQTVSNVNGMITFAPLNYDTAGIYEYELAEVQEVPAGYIADKTVHKVVVTVIDNKEIGELEATVNYDEGAEKVVFANILTSVKITKVDILDAHELEGAHLQILDPNGTIVAEWDSAKEAHEVTGLKTGVLYTLRETAAPAGYVVTNDTTFALNEDGTIDADKTTTTVKDGVLLVEDTRTRAEITKLDAATEAPLSGAVLRVIDANGATVDEWTTDGQPHVIEAKLVTGATYQLIEVKAPDGYEIADPISFTMKADGTTDPVVMRDAMTRSETASISVTKQLTFSGEAVGAVDATFYVALYADEACTKRISEILPLVFKNASSSTVTFTNVEIGRTYYVGECDANGVNYVSGVMAGDVAYAAVFANGNKATVTEADGTATVYFENQFATIPNGFYKEGVLTITKKLLGSDKKAKDSNEVFYAGIFSDAAHTQLSGDVSENIVALDLAGGSEAEAEVIVAIAPGGTQTLYVTEVDANGKPVAGAAGFKYTVQVDKTSVTLSEANAEAHVTITNTENETETESETKKSTSVKTGDDTPIAPYMALMFASMAMLAAEFIYRRKRRSEK